MNIIKTYNEKELTVQVEGRIDTITALEFEKEIENKYGNFDSLILDFENLEYISSAGLRALVIIEKKLKPEGIPFTITNLNDTINEIFTISGFDKILNIE
jgi:anti-anti-sigma factor